MRNLAVLLGQYTGRHQGRGPKDEQEFKTYLRGLSADEMRSFGGDVDKLFVSPRDLQPYVIRYGQSAGPPGMPGSGLRPGESITVGPNSPNAYNEPLVAYEKTGVEGKRYVAYQTGKVELVDEARLQQLAKP